jgi:hypothetical protein
MNTLRVVLIASMTALIAACASTSTKTAAPSAAPAKAAAPAVANLAGVWTVTTDTPMGSSDSKMTVEQTGTNLKGILESPMGSVPFTGAVDGNNVKFGFDFEAQGTALRIDYVGALENGAVKGKVTLGSYGEGTFVAKKSL